MHLLFYDDIRKHYRVFSRLECINYYIYILIYIFYLIKIKILYCLQDELRNITGNIGLHLTIIRTIKKIYTIEDNIEKKV